jgi:hypothetical protein
VSDSGAVSTGGGQPGAAKGQAQIPAPPKKVKLFVDGTEVEADSRDNLGDGDGDRRKKRPFGFR